MTKLPKRKDKGAKKPSKYKLWIVVRDKEPGFDPQEGKYMSYDKIVVYHHDKPKKFTDDFLNKSEWRNWIRIDVYDNLNKNGPLLARFTKDNPPDSDII